MRDLIRNHGVDVSARARVDVNDFGVKKGVSALALAAATCPQREVYDIVATLLASGADPNAATASSGATPLMAAVSFQNLGGTRALLACPGDKLVLEKRFPANSATALNMAGFLSIYDILDALIEAGANKNHR